MSITKYWLLEKIELFKCIDKSQLIEICEYVSIRNISRNQKICWEHWDSSNLYFVIGGAFKLQSVKRGKTTKIVPIGGCIGELLLLNQEEIPYYAVALEDSVLCKINSDTMLRLMNKSPRLRSCVMKEIGAHIIEISQTLESMYYKDSEGRITDFVLDYIENFKPSSEDTEVKNLLSHQDIADLTNTSRQTVSNVMSKLRREGVIHYTTKILKKLQFSILEEELEEE